MSPKAAELTTHLISILCLSWGLFVFKKKAAENPGQKIMGFSPKTLTTVFYVGIVCFVVLLAAAFFK
jgi:hypothetical protein